jgi:hypothetical protein
MGALLSPDRSMQDLVRDPRQQGYWIYFADPTTILATAQVWSSLSWVTSRYAGSKPLTAAEVYSLL